MGHRRGGRGPPRGQAPLPHVSGAGRSSSSSDRAFTRKGSALRVLGVPVVSSLMAGLRMLCASQGRAGGGRKGGPQGTGRGGGVCRTAPASIAQAICPDNEALSGPSSATRGGA